MFRLSAQINNYQTDSIQNLFVGDTTRENLFHRMIRLIDFCWEIIVWIGIVRSKFIYAIQ